MAEPVISEVTREFSDHSKSNTVSMNHDYHSSSFKNQYEIHQDSTYHSRNSMGVVKPRQMVQPDSIIKLMDSTSDRVFQKTHILLVNSILL